MPDDHRDLTGQLARRWVARGLTRRDFFRLLGAGVSLGALGGLLAACVGASPAPAPPSVTTAPGATPPSSLTPPATAAPARPNTPSAVSRIGPGGATASATPGAAGTPASAAGADYPAGGRYSTVEPIGRRGGGVTELNYVDARTNNPLLTADTASNQRIALQYLSLLGLDPDTALPFPELALAVPSRENGGLAPNGLTYTFMLRRDVTWSDGTPFTAGDVVFTYQALMRKELASPRTGEVIERIAAVSSPDPYTVVFTLKNVVASFLITNCTGAGYGIVPRHILGDLPIERIKDHPFSAGDPTLSVATGPFTFAAWVPGDHATLVRNERFFRGAAALDRYTFRVVRDPAAVAAALKGGEADWGTVAASVYDELRRQAQLATTSYESYNVEYAAFQLDPARTTLFEERGVRQALTAALDREEIARTIYGGLATVAAGTQPVLSFAYAPERLTVRQQYDPRRAGALLDESGWRLEPDGVRAKDGRKLQFTIWTNGDSPTRAALIAAIAAKWREIGVAATPRTEEWAALLTRITENRDFEVFVLGFAWDADPDQSSMWSSASFPPNGFNLGHYAEPQVDALLSQGLAELDRDRRRAIYLELQDQILDDAPAILLAFPRTVAAVNRRLHNCLPNAVGSGPRWNAHLWWVDDGR